MRFFIVITLSLLLSLKGILPFVASTSVLASANSSAAPQDAVMICTGSSYRWVSLSAFYQTGEMIDLEHDAQTPEHLNCPLGAFDLFSDDDYLSAQLLNYAFAPSESHYFNSYQSAILALVRIIDTRGSPLKFI